MYHTLASYSDNVCQKGIINITTSDYQPIFGSRKTLRNKTESHKQISFHSLKNQPVVAYEEAVKEKKIS